MSNDEPEIAKLHLSEDRQPAPETNYLIRRYEELGRPGLTAWGQIAEKHWRKNLPGLYRGLKTIGALLPAVVIAQENAKDRYSQLIEDGAHPEAARELAMKEFLYLDPEPRRRKRARRTYKQAIQR